MNINIFFVCKEKNDNYDFIFQDFNPKQIIILLKCAMGSNQIKVKKNICKYEKIDKKGYYNIDEHVRYVRYYTRTNQSSFDLNCDSKYMDPIFWCSSASYITKDTKFIKLCIQLINRQS